MTLMMIHSDPALLLFVVGSYGRGGIGRFEAASVLLAHFLSSSSQRSSHTSENQTFKKTTSETA